MAYDEISVYGIDEEDRRKLLDLEIARLFVVVEQDHALLFPHGTKIGSGNSTLLQDLSSLAEQIMCNLSICELDTQVAYMDSYPTMFDEDDYSVSRTILTQRLNPESPEKHPGKLETDNSRAYFMLVDYITAVIARLSIRSVNSQSFHTRCLANLATLSVKVKILESDAVRCAEISLDVAEAASRRLQLGMIAERKGFVGHTHISMDDKHTQQDKARAAIYNFASGEATESDESRRQHLINLEMAGVRGPLFGLLHRVAQQIKGDSLRDFAQLVSGQDSERPPTRTFNVTSLVYGTGFSSHPTLVSQERDGEFRASSYSPVLATCHNAFQILLQSSKELQKKPCTEVSNGPKWNFSWRMQNSEDTTTGSDTISTSSPHVVLSVMIPLLCCSTEVARTVSTMVYLEIIKGCLLGQGVVDAPASIKFGAMAHLEAREDAEVLGSPADSRISALATSVIARRKLAFSPDSSSQRKKTIKRVETDPVTKEISNETWRKQLCGLERQIQDYWTIDENAVIIPCDVFVITVLSICLVLVAGGIALGFTLGNRVTSVDPFNITLFCWILAGFFAAVCKSLKVQDWSWRDFLKRRCVCRSVTELASATGIDPQFIIVYLLHNEDVTVMKTRGPFNNAFLRSRSDGFAVDVKPTLRTLLMSGLIPAQVMTRKGPMLAIMEARKDSTGDCIKHYHPTPESKNHWDLVCRMPQTKTDAAGAIGTQDMVLEISQPEWLRVTGLFNDLDCRFR